MIKSGVKFVLLGEQQQGFAKQKIDNEYTKDYYSIKDLINFLYYNINDNRLSATKKDCGKDKKSVYTFIYKENTFNKKEIEQIQIIIPGRYKQLYKDVEKQLDNITNIKIKLKSNSIKNKLAIAASGIALLTIMTGVTIESWVKQDKLENENIKDKYTQTGDMEPQIPEEEKHKAYLRELEQRANEGDMVAKMELEKYFSQEQTVQDSNFVKTK